MSAEPIVKYSIGDYLELEKSTGKQFEFYNGELFEVEEVSIDHKRIVSNTFSKIYGHLEG